MRTTPDPTEKPLDLTGQKKAPAPAPAPSPAPATAPAPAPAQQAKHLHDAIWQKPDGMLETRGYPLPKPKTPTMTGLSD